MAELNVQPKSKSPWWIWLIVAIIVLGILSYFLGGNNENDSVPAGNDADTTGIAGMVNTDPDGNNIARADCILLNEDFMQVYMRVPSNERI